MAPLPVVLDLMEYWSENPPTHVIQAAKAGLGKRKKKKPAPEPEYRPLTAGELKRESNLPEWVQKVRAQRREERRLKQLEGSKNASGQ